MLYAFGEGVAEDTAKAVQLYQKACDNGNAPSCRNLGGLYVIGDGVPRDPAHAAQLNQRACDGGDRMGCVGLGLMYKYGEGVDKDAVKAAQYFDKAPPPSSHETNSERACAAKDVQACFDLARLHYGGNIAWDRELYEAVYADGGSKSLPEIEAEKAEASIYAGISVGKSRALAVLEKTCNAGLPWACAFQGLLYEDGVSVAEDKAKAARLFQKACDGGYFEGCYSLGVAYYWGQGVTKDRAKTAQLYQKACDGGRALACLQLGLMYVKGDGVTKDKANSPW